VQAWPGEETGCLLHSSPQYLLAYQRVFGSHRFLLNLNLSYSFLVKSLFEATKWGEQEPLEE
jgi:hypothetical protein